MLVLLLTFLCYMAYHASRKPPSIVKSVLYGGAKAGVSDEDRAGTGWYPFDTAQGKALLGDIDLAFLGAYAVGMFFAGHLGDRLDLRLFLTTGMLGSGVFVMLTGMAYFWDIHNILYFVFVSIVAGLFQATGWPGVVSVVANWFGKGNRGLIMGLWNAHTSVGNILGTLLAAAALPYGWGWSYLLPGALIIIIGLIIYCFLVVEPADIGFKNLEGDGEKAGDAESAPLMEMADMRAHSGSTTSLVDMDKGVRMRGGPQDAQLVSGRSDGAHGVSFITAWHIPGVATYALTLFFSKLVAYTFLYWLPMYIYNVEIGGRRLDPKTAGNLSILFDVGGVLGGATIGYLADVSGASALVSWGFVLMSVPVLYLYRTYGHIAMSINVSLMMLSGFFVNGPYALITTAVSADLGTHESLQGSEKALATVTAIIDGMGSIGAAAGPVLTGYISELPGEFNNVFIMLYVSALSAALLLSKLVYKEVCDLARSGTGRKGAKAPAPKRPSSHKSSGR